jgi:hypothetical protein
MQLSINAIVILVMAMAVLGLGLAMVRGLLGGGVDQLQTAIDGVDLTEEASSGKPLAGVNAIKIKRDTPEPVAVSFYNADNSACEGTGQATLDIICQLPTGVSGPMFADSQTIPVTAERGTATKVGGIFTTEQSAGTYGCTINIMCTGSATPVESETAFIEVTS